MRPEMPPIFDLTPNIAASDPAHVERDLFAIAASTRRTFLGRGAATVAAGTAGVLASASTADAASPLPSLYPNSTATRFQEIQVDESTHVNIIISAIRSLGGTPRPFPTFTGISGLSATTFLQTAVAFENTGVGAYFGAAPYIYNPAVAAVALSIATVEARHSGFLNTTANVAMVPNYLPYAVPLTIAQVTTAATPFITSAERQRPVPRDVQHHPVGRQRHRDPQLRAAAGIPRSLLLLLQRPPALRLSRAPTGPGRRRDRFASSAGPRPDSGRGPASSPGLRSA